MWKFEGRFHENKGPAERVSSMRKKAWRGGGEIYKFEGPSHEKKDPAEKVSSKRRKGRSGEGDI
jgi:hypothetical protein